MSGCGGDERGGNVTPKKLESGRVVRGQESIWGELFGGSLQGIELGEVGAGGSAQAWAVGRQEGTLAGGKGSRA